jgi:methylmalonyl-CoA/ethylmalonyl-CoA epimerase
MVIDHIGIVVPSLDEGIRQWQDLFGYSQSSDIVANSRQQVRVAFMSKEGSITIKLVEPAEATSPIAAFARKGGGLHHLCFRCDSLSVEVALLKERGARLLVPPEPGEAFRNRNVAFLWARENLTFEMIDTTEKVGRTCLA